MYLDTPVVIDGLGDAHVSFVGMTTQTHTHSVPLMGEMEIERKYPALYLQREVWEELGRPTEMILRCLEIDA